MKISIIILLLLCSTFSFAVKKSTKMTKQIKRTVNKLKKGVTTKTETDTAGKAYKKQLLGGPSGRESLGGEPVGTLGAADGGLGGLGSDMEGYPAGMGAGAEPLGAYEPEGSPPGMEGGGGAQQGLDEGGSQYDNGPAGYSKGEYQQGNDGPPGDYIEGHNPLEAEGPPGLRPFSFSKQPNMEGYGNLGPPPMVEGYLNPPAEMGESMTNNLDAMDKANIQGDSEVAEMVRNSAKGRQNSNGAPMDPSVPAQNDAGFSPYESRYGEEEFSQEQPGDVKSFRKLRQDRALTKNRKPAEAGSRRHLVQTKQKRKKKWKGFKKLQQKK